MKIIEHNGGKCLDPYDIQDLKIEGEIFDGKGSGLLGRKLLFIWSWPNLCRYWEVVCPGIIREFSGSMVWEGPINFKAESSGEVKGFLSAVFRDNDTEIFPAKGCIYEIKENQREWLASIELHEIEYTKGYKTWIRSKKSDIGQSIGGQNGRSEILLRHVKKGG